EKQNMSVERSFEAWEEVQRHGLDLADKLTQVFGIENNAHVVSALVDVIGNRLGQAGVDFGANLNGVVNQFVRRLPVPSLFRHQGVGDLGVNNNNMQFHEDVGVSGKMKGEVDEEVVNGDDLKFARFLGKSQGVLNISSTFNSRTRDVESSLVAKGDFWRVEASRGSSTSANENPSLFLVQLGPLLFVRDSTLLLPLHLSKQHLLWYGYDRKNGLHSLCPAVWSKHRRWLLMSMVCLNPLACSFMDLQFPNGQLTYVAGEGLSTSAFLPVFGGLLQAQGQYPGEMSLHPTFGGNNPGLKAEIVQSVNEDLNLIGGFSLTSHPSAFASLSLGRSKWNGNVGKSGIVLKVETPLGNVGQPSFSVQLNSGIEF
ncbi:hypothetical protein M8C21_004285, partial [Ambrosia artemisiifolia]